MCFQHSAVRHYQKWNWAGSEIIDSTLPVSRTLLAKDKKIKKYPSDIRGFLTIENNPVVKKLVKEMVKTSEIEKDHFYEAQSGNWDLRAFACQRYLSLFTYQLSKGTYDTWQLPEETIVLKTGDCEDFAFLLASMLSACGISSYCIRVAFGRIVDHSADGKEYDHAWVMYLNEAGSWQLLEPCRFVKHDKKFKVVKGAKKKSTTSALTDVEYIPHYVFNRDHLWRVHPQDANQKEFHEYASDRNFNKKFHPAFAASVHASIFDEALRGISWVTMERIKAVSLYVDVNTISYDPRDHFDYAYIDDGWQLVQSRLNSGTLSDFALAAHSIADFYAHSFYGKFAINGSKIPVYDPTHPLPANSLTYDFTPLGALQECSAGSPQAAAALWSGKIISGQWPRWFAHFPTDLKNRNDYPTHRCLPDHDVVAVDSPSMKSTHKLFNPTDYATQFTARRQAAIDHIKSVYAAGKASGKYTW